MNFLDDIISTERANLHVQQGSLEWDLLRCGRFTSSEIYKLMDCGKRPMTEAELKARPKTGKGSKTTQVPDPSKMSDSGLKYIRKKVWETLTGEPLGEIYAYPLAYGKQKEPFAVLHFEEVTGIKTEEVGFQCYTDHAGGSPDRLIGDYEGLEVKCPSSDEQVDYLQMTDHYDLKRNYPQYYWQCASLMLFTGRKKWHFCTYDPRMKKLEHQMTHLIIEWDKIEEDIDSIIKALEGAVKEKLSLIQTLTQ
jgi:hypothetical protein